MSKLTIKPLADRVLIEPLAAETKTASGIYIPDSAKEKPQQGKVVAVGNGSKEEPMTVQIGDTVLYGKFAGTELKCFLIFCLEEFHWMEVRMHKKNTCLKCQTSVF